MRIENFNGTEGISKKSNIKKSQRNNNGKLSKKVGQAANKTSSDSISLSPKANLLNKIEKTLETVPDVRTEKVERLKTEVQEGRYNVDSNKIAGKIINDAISDFMNTGKTKQG